MSKIVKADERNAQLATFINTRKDTFEAFGVSASQTLAAVKIDLASNAYLATVANQNPVSMYRSIMQCATLGLQIGSALGHAYLVPRGGRTPQVTLVVGFKGIVHLLDKSSGIIAKAHAVYDGDEFEVSLGTDDRITHKPAFASDAVTHVYAVATMGDGRKIPEVMSVSQVERIRDSVVKWEKTPWATHFDEMAKKTVLKRLCKSLPVSNLVQRAIAVDNDPNAIEVEFEELPAGNADAKTETSTPELAPLADDEWGESGPDEDEISNEWGK